VPIHAVVNIAVVVVFTKYDLLVNQHKKNAAKKNAKSTPGEIPRTPEEKAADDFNNSECVERIRSYSRADVQCAKVSTRSKYPRSYSLTNYSIGLTKNHV
jgi:hypothetical protein